jgi:hypothetical protein
MTQKHMLILCLLLNISGLFLAPSIIAHADPTPTPRMYNRADLLTRLAPKPYATFPVSVPFQTAPLLDSTVDGGGWLSTFLALLNANSIGEKVLGMAVVMLFVFWLSRQLTNLASKRSISPGEAAVRETYTDYKKWRRESRR